MDWRSLLVLCSVPLLYLFISLFVLNRDARLTKYQSQLSQAVFLWFLVAAIQLFFTADLRPQSLLPLAPAVSFFFTHFFLLIRRRTFAELNGYLLVIGVASTAYLSRYEMIPQVDFKKLYTPSSSVPLTGSRVLVLADDPGAYVKNTVAPPFISWPLSKPIFERPDEYESVLLVNRMFQKDPPEIILDPENRMEKFFERIPALKIQYKKSETTWVRINN
jgi:hypothetical protein